jgi:hypothetical protein
MSTIRGDSNKRAVYRCLALSIFNKIVPTLQCHSEGRIEYPLAQGTSEKGVIDLLQMFAFGIGLFKIHLQLDCENFFSKN